jgi:hypothetical protein
MDYKEFQRFLHDLYKSAYISLKETDAQLNKINIEMLNHLLWIGNIYIKWEGLGGYLAQKEGADQLSSAMYEKIFAEHFQSSLPDYIKEYLNGMDALSKNSDKFIADSAIEFLNMLKERIKAFGYAIYQIRNTDKCVMPGLSSDFSLEHCPGCFFNKVCKLNSR